MGAAGSCMAEGDGVAGKRQLYLASELEVTLCGMGQTPS